MKIYLIKLIFSDSFKYIGVFLKEQRAIDYVIIHQGTEICKNDKGEIGKLI